MNLYTHITIHPLASSTREMHYLLFCNGQYYEVSYPIVALIMELQHKTTKGEAIVSYIEIKNGNIQQNKSYT